MNLQIVPQLPFANEESETLSRYPANFVPLPILEQVQLLAAMLPGINTAKAIAFATLAPRYRNEGTAMFSLIRNLGSSVGISLVMTVLGHEVQQSHAQISASITPFRDALLAPGVPPLWTLSTEIGRAALDAEVTRQALTIAYLNDFRFMMYLCVLAVPCTSV